MGLAIDPSATWEYVLESDRASDDPRPFTFRFPSYRQYMQVEELVLKSQAEKDGKKMAELAFKAIRMVLAVPMQLEDILTPVELIEMRDNLLDRATMNEIDKKKQWLQSQSKKGSSATAMPPAGDAATVQAPKSQQTLSVPDVSAKAALGVTVPAVGPLPLAAAPS